MKEHQNITDIQLFRTPIQAQVEGKPVRILGTGNMEGASPAYLTVNEDGESVWQPFAQVQINDTACLPLSTDTLQRSNTRNSTESYSGSRK
jgi:hypothetical protein